MDNNKEAPAGAVPSEQDAKVERRRLTYWKYEQVLRQFLRSMGIRPHPCTTRGLSRAGVLLGPAKGIGDAGEDRYLYLFRMDKTRYGFSYDGILRDLTPGAGGKRLLPTSDHKLYFHPIAAASDRKYVYVLDESGMMLHTNPKFPKEIRVITHAALIRPLWEPYFTEEQVRQRAVEFLSGKPSIFQLFCPSPYPELYYDKDAKMFFSISVYGNYYHGYAVDCYRVSKDEVAACYDSYGLDDIEQSCRKGYIPFGAVIGMFEEAPEGLKYNVPYDYYKENFSHYENYPPDWY